MALTNFKELRESKRVQPVGISNINWISFKKVELRLVNVVHLWCCSSVCKSYISLSFFWNILRMPSKRWTKLLLRNWGHIRHMQFCNWVCKMCLCHIKIQLLACAKEKGKTRTYWSCYKVLNWTNMIEGKFVRVVVAHNWSTEISALRKVPGFWKEGIIMWAHFSKCEWNHILRTHDVK